MSIETAPFQNQLLTTRQQLEVLREYNQIWGTPFDEAQFQAVAVTDRSQTLEDMHVLHVEFEDQVDTIAHWKTIYMNSRWSWAHWNSLPPIKELGEFIGLHDNTVKYEPGIHVVRLDLTQGQYDFTNIKDVHHVAAESGTFLAHSEVLSLVGIHKAFRAWEGYAQKHTPYLPGYAVRNMFKPNSQDWNWTMRFDSSGYAEHEWGLRAFPSSESLWGAVPLVHAPELPSQQ
ncbi:MAG TPA: hypothetical protein VJR27_02565 [Candidatus Saccharimonadales bacterium]|nr:hypothetical protein [Candidatus Saccharimonadales bacterium]